MSRRQTVIDMLADALFDQLLAGSEASTESQNDQAQNSPENPVRLDPSSKGSPQ